MAAYTDGFPITQGNMAGSNNAWSDEETRKFHSLIHGKKYQKIPIFLTLLVPTCQVIHCWLFPVVTSTFTFCYNTGTVRCFCTIYCSNRLETQSDRT